MATAKQGYDALARAFHWITAILIIALFALGWTMSDLDNADPEKFRLYQIHKSIGITVLLLALLRLGWRATHKAPPWPSHMAPWERLAAAGAHWALYGLILLQPFLGVLQSNAANFPIVFWGGFELPALIAPNETIADLLLSAHHLLANVLAGLVLLHVAAALRHHIQLKDDVLRNMMPSAGVGIGVVILSLAMLAPPFLFAEKSAPEATTTSAAPDDVTNVDVTNVDAAGKGETAESDAAQTAPDDQTSGDGSGDAAAAGEEVTNAQASGDGWTVEDGSALGFVALQQGSEVKGGFEAFDALILFDPDDLENSRIDVDIDMTSVTTGHGDRDKTLKSASFFDVETWPSAAFKSGTITATGDGQYEAAGTLTMRDVTRDVVLPFTLVIEEEGDMMSAQAKGELPILRLDYGIGQGDWTSTTTVADEVVITIDIVASKPL